MPILTSLEIANWTALYVATAIWCLIAVGMSVPMTLWQATRGAYPISLSSRADVALALPRLWWRWQKLYLTGTPVVLLIVIAFASTMRWS